MLIVGQESSSILKALYLTLLSLSPFQFPAGLVDEESRMMKGVFWSVVQRLVKLQTRRNNAKLQVTATTEEIGRR